MIVPGTVFGTVGALAAFPLRLAQREVERRHAELRRGITRRTSHVLFGRTLLARVGLAKAGEVSDYYPVNLEFHSELAKMCGNERLAQIYLGLARELHIQRYRALASDAVLDISNHEHRAILDAVAAHDPQQAFAAGRAHIVNGAKRTRRATEALRHGAD